MSTYQHQSDKERRPLDFYPTPTELTDAILPALERFRHGAIWEPCCGDGAIASRLAEAGHDVLATDVHDYGFEGQAAIMDFLSIKEPPQGVSAIVTNPPYDRKLCPAIVRHALDLMGPTGGAVFMLLRHNWDSAGGRTDLYERPFVAKHTMLWRPRWFEKKAGDSTPMHTYAWYEWDHNNLQPHGPVNYYIPKPKKGK